MAVAEDKEMQQLGSSASGTPMAALAIGAAGAALGLLLAGSDVRGYAVVLFGIWLIGAALIRHVASHEWSTQKGARSIPIRFSGGLGPFEVRSRGDGRRVQVVGPRETVVAELIAADEGDELTLDFDFAIDADVDAFGAAIGLAIEMVAAADEDIPAVEARRGAEAPSYPGEVRLAMGGTFRGPRDGSPCRPREGFDPR